MGVNGSVNVIIGFLNAIPQILIDRGRHLNAKHFRNLDEKLFGLLLQIRIKALLKAISKHTGDLFTRRVYEFCIFIEELPEPPEAGNISVSYQPLEQF